MFLSIFFVLVFIASMPNLVLDLFLDYQPYIPPDFDLQGASPLITTGGTTIKIIIILLLFSTKDYDVVEGKRWSGCWWGEGIRRGRTQMDQTKAESTTYQSAYTTRNDHKGSQTFIFKAIFHFLFPIFLFFSPKKRKSVCIPPLPLAAAYQHRYIQYILLQYYCLLLLPA